MWWIPFDPETGLRIDKVLIIVRWVQARVVISEGLELQKLAQCLYVQLKVDTPPSDLSWLCEYEG
jgi:hypothetical protein